jgi:Rod binding domain-containing protein
MSQIPSIPTGWTIPDHVLPQKEQDRLKEAAAGFESLFVKQMMAEMRKTVPDSGLIKQGQGEKIFRDMLDQEYATEMSRRPEGYGLKESLYEQMTRDLYRPPSTATDNAKKQPAAATGTNPATATSAGQGGGDTPAATTASQEGGEGTSQDKFPATTTSQGAGTVSEAAVAGADGMTPASSLNDAAVPATPVSGDAAAAAADMAASDPLSAMVALQNALQQAQGGDALTQAQSVLRARMR